MNLIRKHTRIISALLIINILLVSCRHEVVAVPKIT